MAGAGHWRLRDHEFGSVPSSSAIPDPVLLELVKDVYRKHGL